MALEARNRLKVNAARALLFLLLLPIAACSQAKEIPFPPEDSPPPAELRAKIDKPVAYPGDVITFTLEAEHQPEIKIELPEISDRFSEFRLITDGRALPKAKGGSILAERWYKLQADTAGSYIIDPIEVAYTMPDGTQATLRTPRIFLEVVSLLEEEGAVNDIRDIKPPVDISNFYRIVLLILAALLGAVLLTFIGGRAFARWRRRAREQKLSPRPPHEEALEALRRLLAKGLIEKGRPKEFCFEISEILRRYMHGRFDFPAIDLTTEEILPRIEDNGIVKDSLKPLVREFLTQTDLVKFAKHLPTRDELDKIIEDTRTFINETALMPVSGAEPTEGGEAE
jgi:hypothetical protein